MVSKRYNLPHLAFFQGFEAAARMLSFTKAAEELFITQSAVSRQIKALEDHLGLKLFERRPRSLTLTENGQALYRIATDVLDRPGLTLVTALLGPAMLVVQPGRIPALRELRAAA